MSTLDVTRSYADDTVLTEAQLDAFLDDLETFVNTTKLSDSNFQTEGITASTKLVDASVNAALLASNSVGTAQLAANSVTAVKLDAAIAGSGLTQGASGELNVSVDDSTLTTSGGVVAVKDAGITNAKRAAKAGVTGTNTIFTTSDMGVAGAWREVSGSLGISFPVQITISATGGRPWLFFLRSISTSGNTGSPSRLQHRNGDNANSTRFALYESGAAVAYSGTFLSRADPTVNWSVTWPSSAIQFMFIPSAGVHTYSLYYLSTTGTLSSTVVGRLGRCALSGFEL